MIRIKQIGQTCIVQIETKVYTVSLSEDQIKDLFKYTVKFNETTLEFWKFKVLDIVKPKEIQTVESQLKGEQKLEKRKLENIEKRSKGVFTLKNNSLQIKGLDIDFPFSYVAILENMLDQGYNITALRNFLELLALNPSAYVRDHIFNFLHKNQFPITENGYLVCLRRVWLHNGTDVIATKPEDTRREEIISAFELCKLRKKSPANFYLKDKKLTSVPNGKSIKQLMEELPKEEYWYTDNYTKTFRWKLQQRCFKSRGESVGHENSGCSSGFFHLGNAQHVLSSPSYGNIILLCLVNPMNCTNVPPGVLYKFGVCDFFPVAEIDEEDVIETFKNPFEVIGTLNETYERLDFFNEFVPQGFNFTKSERLEKIREKLEQLKTNVGLYQYESPQISDKLLKEMEKVVTTRIVRL